MTSTIDIDEINGLISVYQQSTTAKLFFRESSAQTSDPIAAAEALLKSQKVSAGILIVLFTVSRACAVVATKNVVEAAPAGFLDSIVATIQPMLAEGWVGLGVGTAISMAGALLLEKFPVTASVVTTSGTSTTETPVITAITNTTAIDALNAANQALLLANQAMEIANQALAKPPVQIISSADANALTALQTAWAGTSLAYTALQTAWSGTAGVKQVYPIAVAGTNLAQQALSAAHAAAQRFVYIQTVPAGTWSATHFLGYQPTNATVWIDNEIVAVPVQATAGTFTVVFGANYSGELRMS